MRFKMLYVVPAVLVAFCAVLSFGLGGPQAEEQDEKNLKVIVADLSKIVENYTRKADEENKLKKVINAMNEQIKAIQERIGQLDTQIRENQDILGAGSEELEKLQFERDKAKLEMERLVKKAQSVLNRGKISILTNIYDDFNKVCAVYAKKHGYDLVLAKNQPNLGSRDYENLMLQISMQPVYYFSDKMDATDFILAEMERMYTETKEAEGEEAPVGPAVPEENPEQPAE